jgi:hypothetical protein
MSVSPKAESEDYCRRSSEDEGKLENPPKEEDKGRILTAA